MYIKVLHRITKSLKLSTPHLLYVVQKAGLKILTKNQGLCAESYLGKRLSDSNFHSWKMIPSILFSDIGGLKIVFHSGLKFSKQCKLIINEFPKFYQELVHLWSNISEKEPSTAFEICREVL